MNFFRRLVSLEKRRHKDVQLGIELDLSYITPRIIAMGYPSSGIEVIYRNPMSDTKKFLDTHHKDHYRVYNLCCEPDRQYDDSNFYGRVGHYPFPDHNCPNFDMLEEFCKDAEAWMSENKENVCAIHCKAGKGRTGLMICVLLMWIKQWNTANETLRYYGFARTKNLKGLTIPSQIRYVYYFERYLYHRDLVPDTQPLIIRAIRMNGIPNFKGKPFCPSFVVMQNDLVLFDSASLTHPHITASKSSSEWKGDKLKKKLSSEELSNLPRFSPDVDESCEISTFDLPVDGDLKCLIRNKDKVVMTFWFNTRFVDESPLVLVKNEIDKAVKDKKCKKYPADFSVSLFFSNPKGSAAVSAQPTTPGQALLGEHKEDTMEDAARHFSAFYSTFNANTTIAEKQSSKKDSKPKEDESTKQEEKKEAEAGAGAEDDDSEDSSDSESNKE